ncbi:MAG: cell division protein ZapA [Caulobacteraceae bacterium]|nr:cell division protein ZapA [Caulobacteraceae bacterium]
MATVTVEINGRPYAVGCADGQEERVRILAKQFDTHVRQVAADVGHVGDIRLFLMAALVLADELHEVRMTNGAGAGLSAPAAPVTPMPAEPGVAEALNAVAARIEKIAQGI